MCKHVRTVPQLFNLHDNDLQNLASFLDHRIDIHKKYYRMPSEVKILIALEQGKTKAFAGKSLKEIDNIKHDHQESHLRGSMSDSF